MVKLFFKRAKKSGLHPGALVFVGDKKLEKSEIKSIEYNQENVKETSDEQLVDIKNKLSLENENLVHWINIVGLDQINNIEEVGEMFDLHPLTLEDILNMDQRPKLEEFQKYLFIVIKMILFNSESTEIDVEQVSLVLGKDYLISFQEREGDVFEGIRSRIRTKKGRTIRQGSDYLAYSLIDAVVDNYFNVLEKIGEKLEDLEEEIISDPQSNTLQNLYSFKREMILLRKSVWPLRELIGRLVREENEFIQEKTIIYLRDVYDHTIQIIDTIETYRDLLSGMLDIYLSSKSNQMNEIMKVLTIMATLFIPLTFITGLYGMNFDMPELHWQYGYLGVWIVMISLTVGLLVFFRKREWL